MPEEDFDELYDDDKIVNFNEAQSGEKSPDNVVNFPNKNNEGINELSGNNSLSDKINENKNKQNQSYRKANSSQESFDNLLNNKNYYKDRENEAKQRLSKSREGLKNNKTKQDDAKDKLNNLKEKRSAASRTRISGSQNKKDDELKEAKNEVKEYKKEEKSLKQEEKQAKNDLKNIKNDKRKALSHAIKNPKDAAAAAVNAALKPIKIKIMTIISSIILGFVGLVLIVYLILGPIMESWEEIDRTVRGTANTVEKLKNFYRGFGFQDSKQAFFTELKNLDDFYDNQLDMPLLLSTIFYPEAMGYDTSYQDHLAVINNDPITAALDGGVDGVLAYFKDWAKDILSESENTFDDDTQLTYNSGKIYRLMRLSAAMCKRDGRAITMSLSQFNEKYKNMLSNKAKEVIGTFLNATIDTIVHSFIWLAEILTLQFDNALELAEGDAEQWGMVGNCLEEFLKVFTFGLCTIVSFDPFTKEVTYIPYTVDENGYNDYLENYYLENTPEFTKLLPSGDAARTKKKKAIINEIYSNRDMFKELFYDYESESSEEYSEFSNGAIDRYLARELALPIDVADGTTIAFSQNDSYGFSNGFVHNGVTLTNSNSGINIGDNVYSVAKGKIVGIGKSNGEVSGDSSGIFGSFTKYRLTDDELHDIAAICAREQGTKIGAMAEASLIANRYELFGSSYSSIYSYLKQCEWWGAEESVTSAMQSASNLTEDILEGVRDVLINGNRTLPQYVDEHDCIFCGSYGYDVTKITTNGMTLTSSDNPTEIRDHSNYVSGQTVITNAYGAVYTFYTFPTESSDPFGYTSMAYNASQNLNDNNSNWIKIEHEVVANNTEYKFYTVYKYLGEIDTKINVGTSVVKGEKIGTVGQVEGYNEASLYFEFRNENDEPIDPTNLFVPDTGSELVGNDNMEKIWNFFVGNGYTKAGTAGIMGNMQSESSFIPQRLQGDFSDGYTESLDYTDKVDRGVISEYDFVNNGPGGGGYGLAQWTYYDRKQNLYNKAKEQSVSIGDLQMQLEFYVWELENNKRSVYDVVMTTDSVADASYIVLYDFENPEVKNISERESNSINIYHLFAGN